VPHWNHLATALLPDLIGSGLGDRLQGYVAAPGFAPVAVLVAFGAGAMHALAPGHGKSLAAAYLVGSDGKVRDAAWLGGSVAVMHTVSCLVLAVAWTFFSLSGLVRMETLTTVLQLVAGLLVLGTGVWLVRRHLGSHGHGHDHTHGHTHGHGHGHGHSHTHGHDHSHGVSRPGLVLLGISGGLTPSPAAFLVLVTGLYSGRAGFALVLVVCFGTGLATVLFAVGVLALTGRDVVVRAAGSRAVLRLATRVAPVLAAGGVTLLGCGITALAAVQLASA
jgi:nickel/cobalt transporter (NicO) family protein